MATTLLDGFTSRATMLHAESELLSLGSGAVPILASVLTGEAKNEFGVAYRELGMPLECALEVACRLGSVARPLESLLRAELHSGSVVAARALGALGSIDTTSIEELAAHLDYADNRESGCFQEHDLAIESALALLNLDHEAHPAVTVALRRSTRATTYFEKAKAYGMRWKR